MCIIYTGTFERSTRSSSRAHIHPSLIISSRTVCSQLVYYYANYLQWITHSGGRETDMMIWNGRYQKDLEK